MIYMALGAAAALILTFLTDGKPISQFSTGEIFQSVFMGAVFGLFITNSPCARGRC
jgi:1,4-dihydroxy-2-naphthoate octaprenyltransferase